MFNYMECPRPLWRALLAQSVTIAVALLIELVMVRQGLALDRCEKPLSPPLKCPSMHDRLRVTADFTLYQVVEAKIMKHRLKRDVRTTMDEILGLGDHKRLATFRECNRIGS